MTRRLRNLDRLRAAANAAVRADAWISEPAREIRLAGLLGEHATRRITDRMLAEPRLRDRIASRVGQLFQICKDHPELAPWLATPQRLAKLGRCAGAVLSGGTMQKIVSRDEVGRLVDLLGKDVWKIGVEKGGTSFALGLTPEDVVEQVEAGGKRALKGFLAKAAPSLVEEITRGINDTELATCEPARDERSQAAVRIALEHATP